MKRKLLFLLGVFLASNSIAQVSDSARSNDIKRKVNSFFQKQHRISYTELKDLHQQYIVYATFEYAGESRVTLLPEIAPDSLLDYRVRNYVSMLIYRSGDAWKRLGYDDLNKGDPFGFVFILTPKHMTDSLNFIGKQIFEHYRTADDRCVQVPPRNEKEQRWQYLAGRSMQYALQGTGLGNRYQTIYLQY